MDSFYIGFTFYLYKMEELIASKYEDISDMRKTLCIEILTSEKNDKSLQIKQTILYST